MVPPSFPDGSAVPSLREVSWGWGAVFHLSAFAPRLAALGGRGGIGGGGCAGFINKGSVGRATEASGAVLLGHLLCDVQAWHCRVMGRDAGQAEGSSRRWPRWPQPQEGRRGTQLCGSVEREGEELPPPLCGLLQGRGRLGSTRWEDSELPAGGPDQPLERGECPIPGAEPSSGREQQRRSRRVWAVRDGWRVTRSPPTPCRKSGAQ